jgi:hypothetical protein
MHRTLEEKHVTRAEARSSLQVQHGAGQGAGDPVNSLDLRHYEPAELVDAAGLVGRVTATDYRRRLSE